MRLTLHQEEIIVNVLQDITDAINTDITNDSIVELTGAAGVGKTFCTIHAMKQLKFEGRSIAITSPTHSAIEVIKNISHKVDKDIFTGTIHSFLNLRLKDNYETGKQELIKEDTAKVNKCDILLIDEKSMVCGELEEHIKDAISKGNIKVVLLIGDDYQLPCQGGEKIKVANSYELIEIVRQALDSPIIKLATEIRHCIKLQKYPSISKILDRHKDIDMYNHTSPFLQHYATLETNHDGEKVIGCYTNNMVNNYNMGIRNVLHPNKEYVEVGDTFILQQPNVTRTSGDTVEVHHTNGQRIEIKSKKEAFKMMYGKKLKYFKCFDTDSEPIMILDEISQELFKGILSKLADNARQEKGLAKREAWKEFFAVKEEFTDVKYSQSSTIHKLQGSSFKYVGIDIRDIENHQKSTKKQEDLDLMFRLLYVGITRASEELFILRN